MSTVIKISKRLQTIASFIRRNTFFADIGSDHAYLPCYVCLRDKHAYAIAGEVRKGPFLRAKETVKYYDLKDRIDVRLGDGLHVIREDKVREVVIAGMGGSLIESIIQAHIDKLTTVDRFIIQPNNNSTAIRELFLTYNFSLIHEVIIEEKGHIYEVLVAEQDADFNAYDQTIHLDKQLMFGPILMQEKSVIFMKKWQDEKEKLVKILRQMNEANDKNNKKIALFKRQLQWIEEVLQ